MKGLKPLNRSVSAGVEPHSMNLRIANYLGGRVDGWDLSNSFAGISFVYSSLKPRPLVKNETRKDS